MGRGAARRRAPSAVEKETVEEEGTAEAQVVGAETWWTRWVWRRRRRASPSRGRVYVLGPVWRFAAILLLGLLLSKVWDRQRELTRGNARLVSDHPSFSHTLGRFTVHWDQEVGQLAVTHKRYWCLQDCSRPVWETVPGVAFLSVADGSRVRFRSTLAGHFRVSSKPSLRTTVQTLDAVEYNAAARSIVLSGMLVKEHALPRVAWLRLSHVRAAWQELGARLREHQAHILLRTSYTMTLTEVVSPTAARLAWNVSWDQSIVDGLKAPLTNGVGRWRTVHGDMQEVNVSRLEEEEDADEGDASLGEPDEDGDTEEVEEEPGESSSSTEAPGRQFTLLRMTYAAEPGERFYGLGAQFSSLDHLGKRVPIMTQEQGIGRGRQPMTWALNKFMRGVGGRWYTTYTAVPHYVSSHARSLFVATRTYLEFDFTKPGRVAVEAVAPHGSVHGELVTGHSPLEVVEAYTEHVGRMSPLPEWTQRGLILGMTGGQHRVLQRVAQLQDAGCPVVAVWLQDWTGMLNTSFAERVWWNWQLDTTLYPDWIGFASELSDRGVAILTYVNTFLSKDAGPKGAMYRHAAANGYLVKNPRSRTGAPYPMTHEVPFGLLDLSNPQTVAWMESIIAAMALSAGVDPTSGRPRVQGWMADFGEYLPFDAHIASGEHPVLAHNAYPEVWAALNRRVLRAVGLEGHGLFFSRSASLGSPAQSPLLWMGDQLVSWDAHDGIKSALLGMLQAGVSGFSLSHSDVGGYTAIPTRVRSKQLLLRWMELSALADAVFRTHQGNKPFSNAQVWDDDDTLAHVVRCARLHGALGPYRQRLMAEAAEKGHPLARAMWMHYPGDSTAATLKHQFLLGADLLMAPVLDQNVSKVHVYLPWLPAADSWRDAWTDTVVTPQPRGGTGVWVTVDAPLGLPAVFVRDAACREALDAVRAMRAVDAKYPGVGGGSGRTASRHVGAMDVTDKLILGYF